MKLAHLFVAILLLAFTEASAQDNAIPKRDPKQVDLFRKDNPCPSTGKTTGACPNFVVDHPWSLCLGGPDIPENMRWQSNIEAQIKDVFERDMCDVKRKLEKPIKPK